VVRFAGRHRIEALSQQATRYRKREQGSGGCRRFSLDEARQQLLDGAEVLDQCAADEELHQTSPSLLRMREMHRDADKRAYGMVDLASSR